MLCRTVQHQGRRPSRSSPMFPTIHLASGIDEVIPGETTFKIWIDRGAETVPQTGKRQWIMGYALLTERIRHKAMAPRTIRRRNLFTEERSRHRGRLNLHGGYTGSLLR
jgi:hypothetical protein